MAEHTLSNLVVAVLIGIGFLAICLVFRRPYMPADVPNSMVKIRERRGVKPQKKSMPDAAKLHEHDKKVRGSELFDTPSALLDFSLTHQYSTHLIERIKDHLSNIRKPHPLLLQLCRKTAEPRDLYLTIRKDPELVAKVLNVANSPSFDLQQPITNLNHAIVFLGMIQVKSIATHFAIQESITFKNRTQQVAYARIWSASFIASSIVADLSKALGMDNAAELSTRCQLSYLGDIGAIVLDHRLADAYIDNISAFERTKRIQTHLEVHQAFLSSIIACQWNLPAQLPDDLLMNLLPMTNDERLSEFTHDERVNIIICYICCRLADRLIFNQQKDFLTSERVDFQSTGFEEFFFVGDLLHDNNMCAVHDVFASATFKRSVHESIRELRST